MPDDSWQSKYNLLQRTAGYSERVRKKREAAAAAQQNAGSEEAPNAELAAQRDLNEAIKEEWNLLLEKSGGTQWHISPKQLVTYDFVEYESLGDLPYTEEKIVQIARMHMNKLNEEVMQLFNATKELSDNINRYFLIEKRSSAINSGEKAIQDSIEIQKTLQAQLQQLKDEEKA